MKMSERLEEAFNVQIGLEFYSAYAYLQMMAYCDAAHLPGMANWLRLQADEEWAHAMRFFDFVLERGNMVRLPAIEAPRLSFESALEVFEEALAHEQRVSEAIRKLYGIATEESDYPSFAILQWFVNEQVEEEANVERIVARLQMAGDNTPALMMLDRELGDRTAE